MFRKDLDKLISEGLLREIRDRSGPQEVIITIKKKRYLNFSSNDYLGLAAAPELREAAIRALNRYCFGSGASRLISGGTVIHKRLERLVAGWKKTESVLILNSGYAANTGIIPAIASEGDLILSDELNHASIIDGCRLSRAKTMVYRHGDIQHLRALMRTGRWRRIVIATDTVFSMDGDIAPLRKLYDVCREANSSSKANRMILYLDDAHGTGVLGKGNGALAHFNIKPDKWIIQIGTFSKAIGSFGAFVASGYDNINWIANNARSFIFSTALPASVIAATIAAISIVRMRHDLGEKLWENRRMLAEGLTASGFDFTPSETPIMPVKGSSIKEIVALSDFLFKEGLYVPAIRPPSVKEPRLRIVVTAAHQEAHIERLLKAMCKWKRRGVMR